MTSRELTSGFNFWSRGHLFVAVMHRPVIFGADIFIQSGVIDIFQKLKMAAAATSDLFRWVMEPPTKPHSWCVPPVKFCHDRLGSFQVIRIWFFLVQAWKSYLRTQNFSFGGILPPKFRGTSFRPPGALPCAERRVLSLHWSRSDAQCDLWPWQSKQKKKKRQWQTDYSPRAPTSQYRSQSLHAVWPPLCSSISSFIKIGPVVLPLWVVENRPSPLLWELAYTTACTTVQAVVVFAVMQCPSVRPSVTFVIHVNTTKHILKFCSPSHYSFSVPNGMAIFRREPSNGGVECKGVWKNHEFRPIYRFISELMQDTAIVTMEEE